MTFRKLWVRIRALPVESWLQRELTELAGKQEAETQARQKVSEVDAALGLFKS